MILKRVEQERFQDYKLPSMFIAFPHCSFKCEKECGMGCCQNSPLATAPNINVSIQEIITMYESNKLHSALVLGGLEPFDSRDELVELVTEFRKKIDDDIVIYTGYYREEVSDVVLELEKIPNIIIKWGRFIPNDDKHFDEILGIHLASKNQYAERIS